MKSFQHKGERIDPTLVYGSHFERGTVTKSDRYSFAQSVSGKPPRLTLSFRNGTSRDYYGADALIVRSLYEGASGNIVN
jgi:hypothetical protein